MNSILQTTIAALALMATAVADNPGFTGELRVRSNMTMNSRNVQLGAVWEGSVASDLVRDGEVLVRRGTRVEGVVETVQGKNSGQAGRIGLKLTSISGRAVESSLYEAEGSVYHKPASKTMTGWAIAGALVGGILHGGKGAAAGAAAGAGIGGLRSLSKQRDEAVIPAESILVFQVK